MVQTPAPVVALALALLATAMLAMCGAASAAGYPDCTWSPDTPTVIGGQTLTVTITCTGDPGDQYALRITDAPRGLTASVAPAAAPNTFALQLTAPADASTDYATVGLTVDGGAYPTDIQVSVNVQRIPKPGCEVESPLPGPAGSSQVIFVRCETTGRDGEAPKLEIVEQPKHGALGPTDYDLGWTYTPNRGFVGADHFTFLVRNSFGVSPLLAVAIRVRKPTRYERDAEYVSRVCANPPKGTSCRAGRGRRTTGGVGTGKVSHRHWPAITGVFLTFPNGGGGRLNGAERADELLGHHASDTIFGGAGRDIIWGDWDPVSNNRTQSDSLNGGGGSDFIYTSHGHNIVTGGPGKDFIWAFYGHGTIDCGPGIDTVRLSGRKSAYKLHGCERRGTF